MMLQLTVGPADDGMGWLEWSSSVIGSTAWPIALVVVALIFRGQITKLLKRIKGAKYGDAQVSFGEDLDKVERKVEVIAPTPEANEQQDDLANIPDLDPTLAAIANEHNKFAQLAAISPSAAVLNSWTDVEFALRELMNIHGISSVSGQRSGFQMGMTLHKQKVLDRETMDVINELKNLRNDAAHGREVSLLDAYRFADLARKLIRKISSL